MCAQHRFVAAVACVWRSEVRAVLLLRILGLDSVCQTCATNAFTAASPCQPLKLQSSFSAVPQSSLLDHI